jgi:hypothetical protein
VITESVHYDDSGAPELLAPELDRALERARAGRGFVWLAVVDPGADEIEAIQERFGLPALAVEDAQEGHQRPKLEPVDWVGAAGTGEVYTYSIHYIGPSKAYKGDPPHVVVLVDLDEGVRMMSNLVRDESPDYPSIDPDDVSIGMRVRVVFHDVTDEITLPKFVPA